MFKYRGPPGTHSVDELFKLSQDFKSGQKGIKVPIFAKHLHNGKGDRTGYRTLEDDTSIILIEGWMLGYRKVDL